jgi:transcription antitermination factor NusG
LNYWFILTCHPAKESQVSRAINRMSFETFTPMDVRSHRVPRARTKRRIVTEVPLIPRCVFVKAPHSAIQAVSAVRWAIRVARDPQGLVSVIRDQDMTAFITEHGHWLHRQKLSHASGERRAGQGRKVKVYKPTTESFREIYEMLFGAQPEQEQEAA